LFLKHLFSTDHEAIGLLYAFTSLFFLLFGFVLVLVIRWQLAFPGEPVPFVGTLLGDANAPGGIVLPEFYNQLSAMHGTIISIMSVVILTSLVLSLWGGSIRFTTPMLFALAFLPMFGIGGLTGLPLGLATTDIPLHCYELPGLFQRRRRSGRA
jgi:cytochrome c oxidase subunit 1